MLISIGVSMTVDVVQYSQRCNIIGHIRPLRWVLWSDFSSVRATPMFGVTLTSRFLVSAFPGILGSLYSSSWIFFVIAMCHQMVFMVLHTRFYCIGFLGILVPLIILLMVLHSSDCSSIVYFNIFLCSSLDFR
jgi:hypothetical protein